MKNTQYLNWKANPSKGEVFTPIELVRTILDDYPTEIWTNPTITFIDPCMGKGVFLIEIVRRLVDIYGFSEEDAKSRVFGCDIRLKYVNYLKRRGYKNVFHGDSLKQIFEMKFDVALGNPPYQDASKPGDNALYQHFTKKVLDSLLKEDGYFSFVVPTTMCDYLTQTKKNRNYIDKFYEIKKMVFDYPQKYFKELNIGTTAFYFVMKNKIVEEESQYVDIVFEKNGNRVTEKTLIRKGETIVKNNRGENANLKEIFLSQDSFNFIHMKTKKGNLRRIRKKQIDEKIVTENPTEKNIFPILNKITKNKGKEIFYYSEIMEDFDKPKLVFCKSGYPMAEYIEEPINLSDNMMYYIPKNKIEGINIANILNSNTFKKVIDLFSTNARDLHKTICNLKKIDLSSTILENDEQILNFFQTHS